MNGDTQGAENQFRSALNSDPDLPDAHLNLGVILFSRNDAAGALEEFKKAIAAKPDYDAGIAGTLFVRAGAILPLAQQTPLRWLQATATPFAVKLSSRSDAPDATR